MDANTILKAKYLDLLFENKNKDYGAYELRKNYQKRLISALLILTCSLFSLALFTHSKAKTKNANNILNEDIKTITVSVKPIAKKPKVEKPKAHPFKKIQTHPAKLEVKSYVPPKIVKDEIFEEKKQLTKMSDLANTRISNFSQEGMKENFVAPPIQTNINGDGIGSLSNGTGDGHKDNISEEETEIIKSVQQEAQYPTGKTGWINYLKRNLRAEEPSANGAPMGNYTVIVSFLVDNQGNISNVKAENDPGYGTAAEAIRVIKKSGQWIPAMQNGRKVTYRQRQQITFQVVSE